MQCARCRRKLFREPVIVEGQKLGPTCAAKVGDLLTQPAERKPARARRARRGDERQLALEVTS